MNFFRKFSEIIGKYCRGARRRFSSDRFLKGEFFSESFGNYWKLLENIVRVRIDESLQTGSYRLNFFRKFSEIIGKYCRSARLRISSDRFIKCKFFFGNFRKLLENIVRVRDDKSLKTSS